MNPTQLIKDRQYLYTAGVEPEQVAYLYQTINGYKFTNGEREEVLSVQSVSFYIEEITRCDD